MNIEETGSSIIRFILNKVVTTKKNGVVLGISGGIDSAVTAALATVALNQDSVHGILMPFYQSHHFKDAMGVVHGLQIPYSTVWINKIYDAFYDTGLLWKDSTKENLMARIRMCLLYAYANEHNLLVIGTCNLPERKTGYFTKHGDGASDFEPLGKSLKRHVYALGRHFNETMAIRMIPEDIFSKEPTAELHPDQKDIDDLGPYEIADRIIENIVFGTGNIDDIDDNDVRKITRLVELNKHKLSMPEMPVLPDEPVVTVDRFINILNKAKNDPNISDSQFRMIVQNTIGIVK